MRSDLHGPTLDAVEAWFRSTEKQLRAAGKVNGAQACRLAVETMQDIRDASAEDITAAKIEAAQNVY